MEPLGGLHHVTAITGDAARNVAFYTGVLGMRLVKKTVNQDDVSAYHLFYADGKGSPGTDLTFFDWPRTPPNRSGIPSIGPVGLRVASDEAIEWWAARFERLGVEHAASAAAADGGGLLSFADPEGQRLELVVDGGAPGGEPWKESPVPDEFQIRGLQGVALISARPQATTQLLTQVMGFRPSGEHELDGGREQLFEVGPSGPGTEVRLTLPAEASWATQGRGGVHHVAFRVPDDESQEQWRSWLGEAGMHTTPVIDRFYFKSVYFREPGGNLFEIATDGPGFTVDEPGTSLGQRLALPPFLEAQREQIEAILAPLP